MNNFDEIKQATTPIQELNPYDDKGVLSGKEFAEYKSKIPWKGFDDDDEDGYVNLDDVYGPENAEFDLYNLDKDAGKKALLDALYDFNQANKDNPYAIDPSTDDKYSYDDIKDVYESYNNNLALSHWDEIKSKYGDKINEIATKIEDGRTGDMSFYKTNVLHMAGEAYLADSQGMNKDQINFMLDGIDYDGGIMDTGHCEFVRTMYNTLHEDYVPEIINAANFASRGALMEMATNEDTHLVADFLTVAESKNKMVANFAATSSFHNEELADMINATNTLQDYLVDKQGPKFDDTVMARAIEDINDIREWKLEFNEINDVDTPNARNGIIFGDNKLVNLMNDYINHNNNKVDYNLSIKKEIGDKDIDSYSDANRVEKQASIGITIPAGLVTGPNQGKYGTYDVVKVPVDNKFGSFAISDDLVTRNNKTVTLNLPDRDRTVNFYNKDEHRYDSVNYSVSELKDIYDKNWEKLNARDKKLDTKFEATQEFLANKMAGPTL